MNKANYLILIALFFSSIMNAHATENDTITTFKMSIDSLLLSFKNPSHVKIIKQLGGRKIKVRGMFDNGTKSFKQKIKYNGGVKKESIVVHYRRYKKSKLLLMKVVCINDQYFFLQKNTYKSLELALKFSKETYVADHIYRKIEFDENKKVYKRFYLWSTIIPAQRR